MKYIYCSEYFEHIQTLIVQDILRFGLATDKSSKKNSLKVKKSKSKEDSLNVSCNAVFGNSMSSLPNVFVESFGYVPRFIVECLDVLDKHLEVEGLFRKTGSIVRQREYKGYVDGGGSIDDTCAPLDICGLIKQFFRELPNPLLTFELYGTLMTCFMQMKEDREKCASVILNLCLILPHLHLSVLMYLMSFLSRLMSHSQSNKMDASNLAICLAPNLLYSLDVLKSRKTNLNAILTTPARQRSSDSAINCMPSTETTLQMETEIVLMLIENADKIGEVSDVMYRRAASFALSVSSLTSENVVEQKVGCCEKKKRGSGSLQGIVSHIGTSLSRWMGYRSGARDGSSNDLERSSASSVNDSSCRESINSCEMDCKDDKETFSLEEMMAKISKMPHTPKIMMGGKKLSKRKAEESCFTPKLGFSTTKRKALMQSLPQSNILGMTPFPHILKQGGDHDYDGDVTPKVTCELNLNSGNRSFNVKSRSGSSSLKRISSMRKVDNLSPKSKQNVRMKFRGLLRRLSGNKEKNAEKQQRKADDSANESTSSKNSSIFRCSRKAHPAVLIPRPPLLGPLRPPEDDEPDSILFGNIDLTKFPLFLCEQKRPLGTADDETCRDLRRIREQRDADGFFGMHDKLKRSYEEIAAGSPQRNAISLSEPALYDESRKMEEDAKEDNHTDMNGSLLRRGRPNTVRNGLKSLPAMSSESETSQDVNLLETSPISRRRFEVDPQKEMFPQEDVCDFDDDGDADETVMEVLDVAFNEDDLQSIIYASSIADESLVPKVDENSCLGTADMEEDFLDSVSCCEEPKGDDRSTSLLEDFGNPEEDCIQHITQESELDLSNLISEDDVDASKHSSSSLPESSSEDNTTLEPSESHLERTPALDELDFEDVCIHLGPTSETISPLETSNDATSQIRKPTFKVTSEVQHLVDKSGSCTDRYEVQLEDDCIQQMENFHPAEIEAVKRRKVDAVEKRNVEESEGRRTSLSKKDRAGSKKIPRLPISSSFNVKTFHERNPVNMPERHSNIVPTKVRENSVSRLPPISPYRQKKIQEPLSIARQYREEGRVLQRLHSRNRASPIRGSSPIPSLQPKVTEPLIASRVAKYLANVQASTSTNSRLRSPMKSIKRLQQASSPKSLKNGSPKVRRSPVKPPTPRKQRPGDNAIKFDLDI